MLYMRYQENLSAQGCVLKLLFPHFPLHDPSNSILLKFPNTKCYLPPEDRRRQPLSLQDICTSAMLRMLHRDVYYQLVDRHEFPAFLLGFADRNMEWVNRVAVLPIPQELRRRLWDRGNDVDVLLENFSATIGHFLFPELRIQITRLDKTLPKIFSFNPLEQRMYVNPVTGEDLPDPILVRMENVREMCEMEKILFVHKINNRILLHEVAKKKGLFQFRIHHITF